VGAISLAGVKPLLVLSTTNRIAANKRRRRKNGLMVDVYFVILGLFAAMAGAHGVTRPTCLASIPNPGLSEFIRGWIFHAQKTGLMFGDGSTITFPC
jgi:hypothetical protein